MKGNENMPSKGILQTGSKNNTSKTRRISWGENKIKEFEKHEKANNLSGEEYNVSIADFNLLRTNPSNNVKSNETIVNVLIDSKKIEQESNINNNLNKNNFLNAPSRGINTNCK